MASSVFRNFDEYGGEGEDCSNDIRYHDDDAKADDGNGNSNINTNDNANANNFENAYKFTPKYQHSIKNNPMCGICFPEWLSILRKRRHQIEWTVYWPRLLFITVMSILNSIMGLMDSLVYGTQIKNSQIHPRPVFILGHPRTGTTLLHSLLALDINQFCYCSTFCAGFPSCFLWFESIGKIIFHGVIDDTRPMDNVRLDFDLPQEDELATNVISGGSCSPYMPLFFMKQESEFRPYYAFDDKNNQNTNQNDNDDNKNDKNEKNNNNIIINENQRKQKQQQQQRRRLLLKSPVHTARIILLNQLFPECQFIYIHRHPYDVFRSATHMADTTYWYTYLNTPSNAQITEFILRQYEILYERYETGRKQIGLYLDYDDNVEVSFDDLSQQPVQTAQKIYKQLGWNWTTKYQQCLESELDGPDFRSFQRNRHKLLERHWKVIINERWGKSFERFGYIKEE
ncbi:P-loop containing nucleoside triphosphate hydrolase protein [Fragilariopsis cylindrus CCMP1102]|uniref:p-loop containing nucleoside triphosphate hydrolase protein n=1 Tax=Fragilariopsis cylindrus CCMP1102 TaxID=635003 RepID=A0A1E7FST9_9STRA|nr:P-loop containing nucleoside triphosphate hydrolase protein [Fragilariopsis cylindrus CCMP1102]|eukprot:OEU21174.1 P-loop containing nucleoside triphosphate hydrolase protein [Fragilariopsis cylindrus CCMP1102]